MKPKYRNNKSGVTGVFHSHTTRYSPSGQTVMMPYWGATWSMDGIQHRKQFYYGGARSRYSTSAAAFDAAVRFRKSKEGDE